MIKEAVYAQEGKVINVTLEADVTVGDVVVFGDIVGVANVSGLIGELIGLSIYGVWEMTAKTEDVVTVGAKLYWDDTAKELTTTETDNTLAGLAVTAKTAVAGVVNVKFG